MTAARLQHAANQLLNARNMLASIQEANRREGVLNEHVLHSEKVAEDQVKRLGEELARLKASTHNMNDR